MKRILCLWLPNWPIQRIRKQQATISAVVLERNDARGGKVAACCARAVAAGIHPEMPVAEAKSLLPKMIVEAYDPIADRRALEKLAEACEQISPCVGLEDTDEPECLFFDVTNLEHLWGNDAELVARVERYFHRRAYRVRLAVAETIGRAWALAHFSVADARRADWPSESAICNPKSAIHLPIEALRIANDTAVLLRELGIESISQLLVLPRESLTARFGEELLRRLDQFTGAASEVIVPYRGRPPLVIEQALEEPTADRGVLRFILEQLIEQLAIQLAARDQGALIVVCLLRCVSNTKVPLRIGLLQPSASARQLMELVDLHLESLRLTDEVTGIEMHVAAVGRLGQRQGELFADQWTSDPHQLALLVNRLSSRLGYEQIVRPKLHASPVPERAVRYVIATEEKSRARSRISDRGLRTRKRISSVGDPQSEICKNPPTAFSPRPLLLYPEPQSLDVVCVAPDGPPQFVWRDARRDRVVCYWGPERIETLWWRGRSVRRDYYRVATESGEQLWTFRRLDDGCWFLHGLFA